VGGVGAEGRFSGLAYAYNCKRQDKCGIILIRAILL
jgi:hypothetical protein